MSEASKRQSTIIVWRLTLITGALITGFGCASDPMASTESDPVAAPRGNASPESSRSIRRRQEFERALQGVSFLEDRIEVEPTHGTLAEAEAHMQRGDELLERNRIVGAIGAYASAVRAQPELAEAYRRLGRALVIKKGKLDLALVALRTAVAKDPRSAQARVDLALALSRRRGFAEAITEMNAALRLDPARGDAHRRLATWHYYTDDLRGAWSHVYAAEDLGEAVPPQFRKLLAERMPAPKRQ